MINILNSKNEIVKLTLLLCHLKILGGGMSYILDDFHLIGPANFMSCKNDLTNFLLLCNTIGALIKMAKTQNPTTQYKSIE